MSEKFKGVLNPVEYARNMIGNVLPQHGSYKKQKVNRFPFLLKVTSAEKRQHLKMCHLRHRLRIFLFRGKDMFRSQDI